jgi:integrase
MAMSVTIRPYRRGGWEVDIRVVTPDGARQLRERRRAPVSSRTAAVRWAEGLERVLFERLMNPPAVDAPRKEVPTFREFAPRFVEGHARANRQKPSGIAAKETILNIHLVPLLGSKRLDAITTEEVQRLKHRLADRAPKTVNNVLTVLNMLLKKAVEWDVIERVPCTVKLLPVPKPTMGFYDFDEYERLVEGAAASSDSNEFIIVLLGGEAGLRCGEMMALEWRDVDLAKRQICVARSEWKGHVTAPKGGRLRYVPMTRRLAGALREARHMRSARVLCHGSTSLSADAVKHCVERAARRARLSESGVHRLRHTFCSHLAMRGAPARAIQELAGHKDLITTQRYMHLSPAALDSAIRLLEGHAPGVVPFDSPGRANARSGHSPTDGLL